LPPDTLIAAVADGAGSARHSGEGSFLAADAAIDRAAAMLQDDPCGITSPRLTHILHQAMYAAYRRIVETAAQPNYWRPIREYATTLLLVIWARGTLAAAQIGDGAVVASNESGDYILFTTPQRGEYANETSFLTGRNAMQQLQIRTAAWPNAKRIAMFTDGLQNLALEHTANAPFPGFFTPLFNWLEAQTDELDAYAGLRAFLKSDRVTARTGDDTTLLLALREQG